MVMVLDGNWREFPLIPNGSIVRTTWLDEEFELSSDYNKDNNEGWVSPGVNALSSEAMLLHQKTKNSCWDEKPLLIVPHNTKGLLVIDSWSCDMSPDGRIAWYNVLWGEKSIWIHARNIILTKNSTVATK